MSNQLRPYSEDRANYDPPAERPTKIRRIRLACLRCQTRKIKCDGAVPKCTACQKAGVECIDGRTTTQEGSISRSEAAALHDQVQRLEEALRARCPDVNIADVSNGQQDLNALQRIGSSDRVRSGQSPSIDVVGLSSSNNAAVRLNVNATVPQSLATRSQDSRDVAHEIGLIPLSAGVNKYVGPSSGFPFARLLFARADQAGMSPESANGSGSRIGQESPSTIKSRSTFTITPSALPNTIEESVQLSRTYFEHVHAQYPFLHEPSHYCLIHEVYRTGSEVSKSALFQVTMVLAISAIILSKRLRIPFTGEGLCEAAMKLVGELDFQNSTQGVQCLLLIVMFTLHSSYLSISPWHLNYQCLAAVLDLGLQRDLPMTHGVTRFDKEMRTRIFWVIYTLDRTLATTLGRPIGLRDEACELRLPTEQEDRDLGPDGGFFDNTGLPQWPGPVACSIILFKLAQLNSEIKYILHSVTTNTPKYTYPQITDIENWQADLWGRLQTISDNVPKFGEDEKHLSVICNIRYHEIAMLLFRPTPRIRSPTRNSLLNCHTSAQATIRLWKELYETDRMSYSWTTIHSVCLSAVTLLYCIWMVPDIASNTKIDVLTNTMRDSSNLLSAAGEHWTEARRSRSHLDDLTAATVRWLLDNRSSRNPPEPPPQGQQKNQAASQSTMSASTMPSAVDQQDTSHVSNQPFGLGTDMDFMGMGIDTYINLEDFAVFVGAPDPFANTFSNTMEGMFSEYQPLFDFNP